jgi:hypothetical protein
MVVCYQDDATREREKSQLVRGAADSCRALRTSSIIAVTVDVSALFVGSDGPGTAAPGQQDNVRGGDHAHVMSTPAHDYGRGMTNAHGVVPRKRQLRRWNYTQ